MDCSPDNLLAQAKCFNCVPGGMLASVATYLMCQWSNQPSGSSCTLFDTGLIQAGSGITTFNHGFTRTPPIVLPVTVCVANDANLQYVAGDEIPLYMWRTQEEIGAPWGISLVMANRTQVIIQTCSFAVGNEGSLICWQKNANKGRANPSSVNNWRIRVRCFDCPTVVATGPYASTVAHGVFTSGLPGVPYVSICAIRCINNDVNNNYLVNDEVPGWMFALEQFDGHHFVNATTIGIGAWPAINSECWVKGIDYTPATLLNMNNYEKWVYSLMP